MFSRILVPLDGSKLAELALPYAEELVGAFNSEMDTRLVTMSTHGQSDIERWAFGGITHKVLHHGNTPLLLVRAPEVNR